MHSSLFLHEKELNHLLTEGTLEPVEVPEWAAPIIAVLKLDKTNVNKSGDFKHTVNPVSTLDKCLHFCRR